MEPIHNAQPEESEENYQKSQGDICPLCKKEEPDHACVNCCTAIPKAECWKWGGCCGETCLEKVLQKGPVAL